MKEESAWQQAIQACQKDGFRVLVLDQPVEDAPLRALADEEPPPAVQAFAHHWNQTAPDAWHALLQSAAAVNPTVGEDAELARSLEPLRALLGRAEYAALVYGQPTSGYWKSLEQWSYLMQIRPPSNEADTDHLLLHLPASPADIALAEAALRLKLPPGYKHLLMVTNGLGLGTTELTYVCGAGPARASWNPVILNHWQECQGYHEIAAQWREFQGVYDYERIMDWEGGVNTFETDETILVPFAQTYDAWCFDRTRPNADGEYPVMFWDHELRQADEQYPNFRDWFAGGVEPYIFAT
jgi:hypothetical protein